MEGPTHYEDGVEVDFDGEPITRGNEYWLKDEPAEEHKRQRYPRSTYWNVNCDVIFKGPSTPKCDYDEKYKEECVMSGLKVGRLRLPIVSDDDYGDSNYDSDDDIDEERRDFWTTREKRSKYMEATLYINNYEYDVHDLEVLI